MPETPLLGVLPGTGGLTRVVDKRKVRRDLADEFSTLTEGVRGKRAVEWRFVDAVVSDQPVQGGGREARAGARRDIRSPDERPGHHARAARSPAIDGDAIHYRYVHGSDRSRQAHVRADDRARPIRRSRRTPDEFLAAGDQAWALRAFRELDDALLRLRLNEPEIGTVIVRADGDPQAVLDVDAALRRAPRALAGARDHRP